MGNHKPTRPASVGESESANKSKVLNTALFLTAIAAFPLSIVNTIQGEQLFAILLIGLAISSTLGLYLSRRGSYTLAAAIYILCAFITLFFVIFNQSGFNHPGLITLPVLILAAGYLINRRAVIYSTSAVILALAALYGLDRLGVLTMTPPSTLERLLVISIILAVTGLMVWTALRRDDSPIADNMKTVIDRIASFEDDNATTNSQTASSESKIQFRHFARTSADAILLLNDAGKILFVNQAAEDILGLSAEQVLGQTLSDFLTKPDFDNQLKEIDRILSQQSEIQVHELEGLVKGQGEADIPVRLSYSAWVSGSEIFVCTILRDVTEQIETQKWLVFQERLGTLGSLVAGVAHDFNNALMPIILNTQMVLREPELPPSLEESLEIVLRQARHAGELSRQLLSFGTDSQEALQPINMKQTLREIHRLLERTFPENISLEFKSLPGTYYFMGDSNRLEQALMNLAINARDAMPEGGQIKMLLSKQELVAGDKLPFASMRLGEWIRLDITDTGHGIMAEDIPHIFKPFFTTKQVGEGYGLGLAQTYNIVKQHQGFIDVVSRLGRGTTFTLFFPPLEGEEPIDLSETRLETIMGDGQTILVVEDDPQSLQVIRETLEHLNYQVIPTSSGAEATRAYQSQDIDLVISDMVMPDMDGLQLHRRLAKQDPRVRLLIISGYALDEISAELLESGVLGLLKKPVTISTLAGSIFKALH